MICKDAYQALLTAEPEELRGQGETPLAQHIRGCETCAARAATLIEANMLLARNLDRRAAHVPNPVSHLPYSRAAAIALLPLALAAALAAVLLARRPADVVIPRQGSLADVKRPVTRTVVNALPGRDVAVILATDNITVVWNLEVGGGS